MHSRHPSRPQPDLSMQHVLMATIQGRLGFSSGYVWWIAAEEILLWNHEHVSVGDELLLRIDWARGTGLLNCRATVQNVLPVSSTSVSEGRALYATFELVVPVNHDLFVKGLLQANPDLKTLGWGFQPTKLAQSRRKAEHRTGRTLGQKPEAPPVAASAVGDKPARHKPASLGRIRSQRPASRPKRPARVPPASRRFHPEDITPEHPEFEKRSETDELVPVLSADGAKKEFTPSPSSGARKYVGYTTNGRGGHTPASSGSGTSRLQALVDQIRERAHGDVSASSPESTSGVRDDTRASGKKGYLQISSLIKGPPHAILLRISDPAQLRRAVVLGERRFEIYLRHKSGIELGDQVDVLLALPDGTPLEFTAKVDRVKPRSLRLAVVALDEFIISSMEMVIHEETT
jgi:hypothetical protein